MKKTPIGLFLTDTHLSEANIEIVKSIFRQAIKIALQHGLKYIYHLGDIFHSRKGQPQEILSIFDDILEEIKEAGLILVLIPGNHDKADYSSWKSFLKQYRYHPALNLIQKFGGIPITDKIYLSLLPYFEDENYLQYLNEMQEHGSKGKINILGTHIGVQGATMNNGMPVESSITPTHFKGFDLVLIGHYHDPQELADGVIRYIGASLQHNFGEGELKGGVFLYEDLTTEVIPFEFPKYKTFEVDVISLTTKDVQDLKKEKEETGDNIRVILTGKEADIKAYNRKGLIDAGIKVESKEDKINKQELESRIEPFDSKSLNEEFDTFCTKDNLDITVGKNYLNKAICLVG